MSRKPRIGFALEQALGHVAYGMSLEKALAHRDDFEPVWLRVPYDLGDFKRLPVIGKNWTIRGSLRARDLIARAHAQAPLDALFINTQTVSLFSGSLMRKIPTLLSLDATPRNMDELAPWYGDRVHPGPVEQAKLFSHRRVMRQVEWFTTWSEWAKSSLVRDYHAPFDRVTVLPPGTTLGNFPPAGTRRARERTPGKLRLLFVGGDFERKGGDLLLELFQGGLNDLVELHLITGKELPALDGVHVYRGLKPHSEELLRLYREADVFVLPTRADCLAVVLGEAMAAELPIITTRVGAHAEAVIDGQTGYLIDKDDARALRDRITRLAKDPELRLAMSESARRNGEDRFDMAKNAGKIGDILVDLATSKISRRSR